MHAPFLIVALSIMLSLLCSASTHAQKVLIIGMDGVRSDAMAAANTPNLDALIANGTYSQNATTADRTYSGAGWTEILTGVHRDQHEAGVIPASNTLQDNPNSPDPQFMVYQNQDGSGGPSNQHNLPDFLARAKAANASLQTAMFAGQWDGIIPIRTPGGTDVVFGNLNGQSFANDTNATSAAINHFSNNSNSADISFVYLARPDFGGHAGGFTTGPGSYRNDIEATDTRIGALISAIEGRSNFASEDWVFILTSDHGGSANGSHGQGNNNTPWEREVPFIVSGGLSGSCSVQTGDLGYDAKTVDAAATALTHLGIPLPAEYAGHAVGLSGLVDPRPSLASNVNLVFNGDAEYDDGFGGTTSAKATLSHMTDQAITGWNEFRDADFSAETSTRVGSETATVLEYDMAGGFPLSSDPGPTSRGDNFFSAGYGSSTSEMGQIIDVSSISTDGLGFEISAYLGGFSTQDDRADFSVRFLDAGGNEISRVTLTGPDAAGRGNQTGLLLQSQTGNIPAGVDSLEFLLETVGNDGYADNLSFMITDTISQPGDFDNDGDIDGADWTLFVAGLGSSTPGATDLNGDGVNNHTDFLAFKQLFENANGVGSFQAIISQVPEPSSALFLTVGSVCLLIRRGRRT